ncbi:5-(carboxyamino)imidazole ribonucleotide mutase [Candidatus Acetothermia bacterium]|jgi:5-(carboxyamino)imidazole ribonucleotide mutase|nr:5-(carboxyamino)imidazole ribonucleotide mutase [Candidatus Acetothermia bacterium]MCI2427123.1 5-(carboxyamino)imidazole ribonucleotide mutase [Candidatus Acetothermia bacterium]MCI2428974.1 5-(carboxyamino)imidazole ribonucleotide mutase [Candidatus Acetothermia bacterium]
MPEGLVGIIMGSDSDLPTMSLAAQVLEELDIRYEITIVSAHRTPQRMIQYAHSAASRGIEVIIAGAGGAAHLPGLTAANTILPVIGVPITTRSLCGIDSLYSILPMPVSRPVATMAIGEDGARNAAYLAAQILGLKYSSIQAQLIKQRALSNDVSEIAL